MKRLWWLAGLSALVALAVLLMPMTALRLRAQAAPATGHSLDQLTGDDFDRAFLAQMTMHHAMAVEMARPLLTGATHPELKQLGQAITDAQTREITQMRAWAKEWYGLELPDHLAMMAAHHQGQGQATGMPGMHSGGMMNPAGIPMHQSMHQGQGMPMHQGQGMPMHQGQGAGPIGMMGDMHAMSMMAALDKLPPNRLEAVFMSLMIPHHQDALDMAALIPDRAAHQEIKDLGTAITTSQSAEIEQMNGWLANWYGL
ncbi:MAG: DUF305 domain-containing protein [Chloroflexi bacterium]|nr:DUF305 domain-containing protein [Chloroflexota bacterium]